MKNLERLLRALQIFTRLTKKGYCSHPDAPEGCSTSISAAHSIQKGILLKSISVDGHVFKLDLSKNISSLHDVCLAKIGLNEASTFRGFCNRHDTLLFKPIESYPITPTIEQAYLFAYRSLSRDLYLKKTSRDFYKGLLDKKWFSNYCNKDYLKLLVQANDSGLNDFQNYKSKLDSIYYSQDYQNYRFLFYVFNEKSPFFCTCTFGPEATLNGKKLQDLGKMNPNQTYINLTVINNPDNAVAIFSWYHDEREINDKFIRSLMYKNKKRIPNLILNLCFEYSENLYFEREWWMRLKKRDRKSLVSRVLSGVGTLDRGIKEHQDDGQSALKWKILKNSGKLR